MSRKFKDHEYFHELFAKNVIDTCNRNSKTNDVNMPFYKKDTDISIGGKSYKVRDADTIKINIPDDMDVSMYTDNTQAFTDKVNMLRY